MSADAEYVYSLAKERILKTAAKVPEATYRFRPTPEVRSLGEILGHVADSTYHVCSIVKGDEKTSEIEKTKTSKAELTTALTRAFAYCDAVYRAMTDADSATKIAYHGGLHTKMMALSFNSTHLMEHYGNLVTYMRLNHIVPPTSEPGSESAAPNQ
ncbi:MAG: DinB family protein [Acidobacteriia bacterium]|nr:DinB family protein [Terriglobia bacterium]